MILPVLMRTGFGGLSMRMMNDMSVAEDENVEVIQALRSVALLLFLGASCRSYGKI
jgi:hypothetical protein